MNATCRCCAGYAVLRYNRAPRKLPTTPPPQPGTVAPWTTEQTAQIVMSSVLLNSKDKSAGGGVYRTAMSKVRGNAGGRARAEVTAAVVCCYIAASVQA
jgi:hypothetical protein